jgi:hypothetical protein
VNRLNTAYSHPANEINADAHVLEGHVVGQTTLHDPDHGHTIYRFRGCLKGAADTRAVEIYIPHNLQTGVPIVTEVAAPAETPHPPDAYLYVRRGPVEESPFEATPQKPAIMLNIIATDKTNPITGYVSQTYSIVMSYVAPSPDGQRVEKAQWEVTPDLAWSSRSKTVYWAQQCLYIVAVPVDVVAVLIGMAKNNRK